MSVDAVSHKTPIPSDPSARRRGLLPWLLACSVLLTLLLSAAFYRQVSVQFEQLDQQRLAVLKSRNVIDSLDAIRERVQRSQRAMGDYVRTHDPANLLLYGNSYAEMSVLYRQLNSYLINAESRQLATDLQALSDRQLSFAARMIETYEREGEAGAGYRSMMPTAQRNLDATNMALATWRKRESAVLAQGDTLADQQLADARRIVLGSLPIGAALTLLLLVALVRDQRRREQLQTQLQITSDLWIATLSSLSQGVGLFGLDGRLVLWNERFSALLGLGTGQLQHGMDVQRVLQISLLEQQEAVTRLVEKLLHPAQPTPAPVGLIDLSRQDEVRLQVGAHLMFRDYYVINISDVTLMHDSQLRLQDQATRLSTIMDSVRDAIITINASGSIESWSAGAERMFGYSGEEVLRRNVKVLMPEAYALQHDGYLQRYLGKGQSEQMGKLRELVARHRDGHEFPIDLSISEMAIAGRRMFVGIIRDITERRAVERMKGEFVSTVSHELRTPLTSIAGSLALLASGAGGAMPQRAQHLLDIANRNSKRLTVLINDILELEKSDAGRLSLKLLRQPLLPLLQQALEANRAYAEQFQVRFELRNSVSEPMLLLDDMRIQQVLANLLSNAVKISVPGATVLIEVTQQAGNVRVTVHDDGPGIPASFRERLFMRFAQADNTDARRNGGTGLGLSITKALVELHGGQIGFDSGHSAIGTGQGASFWFQLPLAQPDDETDGSPTVTTVATLSGARIMVCDDDPDITELVSALLQQHGCYVEVVSTAFVARERLRQQMADLLVVDMNLPDVDGLTLVAQLRQQPQLQRMSIVILSAVDCVELDTAMLAALGVDDCLRKPVQVNALIAAVAKALSSRMADR